MSRRQLPDFIDGTVRDWRAKKRREFRAIITAYERFRKGCAYTPVYPEINELGARLESHRETLRGNWHPIRSRERAR